MNSKINYENRKALDISDFEFLSLFKKRMKRYISGLFRKKII
jgi:hypothetical protein